MSGGVGSDADRAMALTTEMVAAAERDDWSRLAQLEMQRQAFVAPEMAASAAEAEKWREVHQCNQRVIDRVREARDRVALEWQEAREGHRAARDYQRIARDAER